MRIYKPKNSSFYYYEFVFNGVRYHKSTKLKKEREALTVANAFYTALAKGEVGIVAQVIAPTPQGLPKGLHHRGQSGETG